MCCAIPTTIPIAIGMRASYRDQASGATRSKRSTGSLRERSPGVWEVRVVVGFDPGRSRSIQRSFTVHGDVGLAAPARRDLVAEYGSWSGPAPAPASSQPSSTVLTQGAAPEQRSTRNRQPPRTGPVRKMDARRRRQPGTPGSLPITSGRQVTADHGGTITYQSHLAPAGWGVLRPPCVAGLPASGYGEGLTPRRPPGLAGLFLSPIGAEHIDRTHRGLP
jgi:hypothetical protein